MERKITIAVGLFLLLLGVYLLVAEYGYAIRISFSWTFILFAAGVAMIIAYFTSKPRHDLLATGNVLVALAIFFTIINNFGELTNWDDHWPGIIIAIGAANLATGLILERSEGRIIQSIITIGIGLFLLYFNIIGWSHFGQHSLVILVGVLAVLIGIRLIARSFSRNGASA